MNSRSISPAGYTLIETMVTVAILAAIFAITGTVIVRTAQAWRSQEAYAKVSAALRDATLSITTELESAALEDDNTLTPPVKGLTIEADGRSISYQTPRSLDGKSWSNPTQIRLRSEDSNLNLKIDGNEDADGNGYLDRVIERIEDIDGDGEFGGPGETRILARGIDRLTFEQQESGRKIDVIVAARFLDYSGQDRTLSEEQSFSVVVRN